MIWKNEINRKINEILQTPDGFDRLCDLLKGIFFKNLNFDKFYKKKIKGDRFDYYLSNRIKKNDRT